MPTDEWATCQLCLNDPCTCGRESTPPRDTLASLRAERDDAIEQRNAQLRVTADELKASYRERLELRAERDAALAKLNDATAYCSGAFPCEASTAAAFLERERNDAVAERDALALVLQTGADFVEHGAPNTHFMEWLVRAREALAAPGASRVLQELETLRAVKNAAVAYVDQLSAFNRLDHPEVHRRRLELAREVAAALRKGTAE